MLHIFLLVHIAGITTIIKGIKFGKSSNKEKQGTLNINKNISITHMKLKIYFKWHHFKKDLEDMTFLCQYSNTCQYLGILQILFDAILEKKNYLAVCGTEQRQ